MTYLYSCTIHFSNHCKQSTDETATLNAQAMMFVYSVILMIMSSAALYLSSLFQGKRGKR